MAEPKLNYTPAEQEYDRKHEAARAPQNLSEIDKELARTKDANARKVLTAERARIVASANPLHTPEYADWFPVQSVRPVPGKIGQPGTGGKEANLNGNWIPVENTGWQIREGKPIRVARLGKFAPGWMQQAEYGAVAHLGGLPVEIGESVAAYRAGPGGGAALEAGRRHELGLKFPKIVGTPYESSTASLMGGIAGGAATDPTTYLGLRAGPVGMGMMGGVSGAGSQLAEDLRSGEVHPSHVGVGALVGGLTGMALGTVVPQVVKGTAKLIRWLRGIDKGAANIPAEERKRIFMETLAKHQATGRPGEPTLTDEQIDRINDELEEHGRRYGTSPSKPIAKPLDKTKTLQTGPIAHPDEGNLEDVLPLGRRREPAIGELPETPPPEFTMKGEPPEGAGAGVHEFPDIPLSTDPLTGKPRIKTGPAGVRDVPQPAEAVQVAAPRARRAAGINYNKDTLLAAVAKLGGIKLSEKADLSGEQKTRIMAAGRHVFTSKGHGSDQMAHDLHAEGYIPEEEWRKDQGKSFLEEALRDELIGTRSYYSVRADEDTLYRAMRDQQGGITPMLAARLATTAGGAAAGAYVDKDHPVAGALTGAAVGLTVPSIAKHFIAGGAGSMLKLLGRRDPLLGRLAREPAEQTEAEIAARGRETFQIWRRYKDMNLAPQDQEIIVHAIQAGQIAALPPNLQPVARSFEAELGRIGMRGQVSGAVPHLGRNYVPQMWDTKDPATKRILEGMGYSLDQTGPEGFSTFTPYSLQKGIPNYRAGVQMGLKPKTYDLGDLYAMYATSVNRAVENKQAISMVRQLVDPNGRPLVGTTGLPGNYVEVKGVPELDGYKVHPEIADSLKLAFSSRDPSGLERGLLSLSFAAKRMNTMYSAFHAKSLLEAYTLAGGNPFDALIGAAARGAEKSGMASRGTLYQSAVDAALAAYRTGGAGDAIDYGIRNGLSLKPPIEDIRGLDTFHKILNESGLGAATKIDKNLQAFTWEYMHTGMKAATFMRLFEEKVVANPTGDPNKIAADVAKFVNRTFGGLNWRREVEDVTTHFGLKAGTEAFGQRGLAAQQILMFAPDWTWSTFLSWAKSVPGIEPSKITRELHQQYIVNTVLTQLTVADGVNYAMSGHHLWDNAKARQQRSMSKRQLMHTVTPHDVFENMLYIDLGDGRRMNFMKHGLEVPHMMANPDQFWLNKLGYLPRVVAEGALNKEWLSSTYAPNISDTPKSAEGYAERFLFHPARRMVPFGFQQMGEQGPESIGGFFGFPITGMKTEDLMKQRLDEKVKQFKAD